MTATLPQLFQAVAEIEQKLETERNALIESRQPTCDLAAMAEKLSNLKKQIGALTVGKLRTV